MDHPSDDLLSAYALDPVLVPDRTALEGHVMLCKPCSDRLAEIRAFDARLEDEDNYPDEDDPEGDGLRAAAAQTAREDAEADELLGTLLEEPPEAFVWANLQEKPKYHTGGVVRKLSAAAYKALFTSPPHAQDLADTAIAISRRLGPAVYPVALLASWRGIAYKQRANALRYQGQFAAALKTLDRAEVQFKLLPQPELDLAAVTFIRGTTYYEMEEYGRAAELAAQSTREFEHQGQSEMYYGSRVLEGSIAFELGNLDVAEAIFRQLYDHGEQSERKIWRARAAQALGNTFIKRGALNEATQQLHTAMLLFRELGITIEEVRCRWGVARVVQKSGQHRIAVERFRGAREEFQQLGAAIDAALVTLDLMEAFLALRNPREVRRAAGNVVAILTEAGMVTGALAAANWLRHAAAMETLTPSLLDKIRRYLRRVAIEPDFAFVPPSD